MDVFTNQIVELCKRADEEYYRDVTDNPLPLEIPCRAYLEQIIKVAKKAIEFDKTVGI